MIAPNKRLDRALQSAIPNARVRTEAVMLDGTNLLHIDAGQGGIPLRALWAGAGWPQDVRQALDSIGSKDNSPWPKDLVVVARSFSTGALELLGDLGANWVDEGGRAQIVAPGLVVSREGEPSPTAKREFGWSKSALQIGELLLSHAWPNGFGTTELANLTGWSTPQVSQVLQGFDENRWTAKRGPRRGRGARRELIDADALLEAWSSNLDSEGRETLEATITVDDMLQFLRSELAPIFAEHLRWALSGWAAAQEAAPFMTAVPTLQIYVHEDDMQSDLRKAIKEAGLREVAEGGRIQFASASPGVLSRSWDRGGLPLASAPRIYADLLRLGPRGVEAAENLKQEVIDEIHRRGAPGNPSPQILSWERDVKARLQSRIEASDDKGVGNRYRFGTYSASYLLQGVSPIPSLPEFRKTLRRAVGQETGWPAWQLAESTTSRARPVDGAIECWLINSVFEDPAHADFWRADPKGRLCLVRGYDEDGSDAPIPPGTGLDVTLPVWRVAECLRHAGRLGLLMEAPRVQFMMRWEGLEGRELTSYAERRRLLSGSYECLQDSVATYLEFDPEDVEPRLPDLVEDLVAPLFAAFEFFEAPHELYEGEVSRMRERVG